MIAKTCDNDSKTSRKMIQTSLKCLCNCLQQGAVWWMTSLTSGMQPKWRLKGRLGGQCKVGEGGGGGGVSWHTSSSAFPLSRHRSEAPFEVLNSPWEIYRPPCASPLQGSARPCKLPVKNIPTCLFCILLILFSANFFALEAWQVIPILARRQWETAYHMFVFAEKPFVISRKSF